MFLSADGWGWHLECTPVPNTEVSIHLPSIFFYLLILIIFNTFLLNSYYIIDTLDAAVNTVAALKLTFYWHIWVPSEQEVQWTSVLLGSP